MPGPTNTEANRLLTTPSLLQTMYTDPSINLESEMVYYAKASWVEGILAQGRIMERERVLNSIWESVLDDFTCGEIKKLFLRIEKEFNSKYEINYVRIVEKSLNMNLEDSDIHGMINFVHEFINQQPKEDMAEIANFIDFVIASRSRHIDEGRVLPENYIQDINYKQFPKFMEVLGEEGAKIFYEEKWLTYRPSVHKIDGMGGYIDFFKSIYAEDSSVSTDFIDLIGPYSRKWNKIISFYTQHPEAVETLMRNKFTSTPWKNPYEVYFKGGFEYARLSSKEDAVAHFKQVTADKYTLYCNVKEPATVAPSAPAADDHTTPSAPAADDHTTHSASTHSASGRQEASLLSRLRRVFSSTKAKVAIICAVVLVLVLIVVVTVYLLGLFDKKKG